MSAAKHTPAGVELSLRIGQRVRHQDYKGQRVIGVVVGMTACVERGLMVDFVLDAPIVIPPGEGCAEIKIHRQCVQAHELSPFDDRDELVAELLAALELAFKALDAISNDMTVGDRWTNAGQHLLDALPPVRAAIAKATGSAS